MITGKIIELIPAEQDDRRRAYDWCFQSETTKAHSGPPDYPDVPILTFEEFCDDHPDYYFNGTEPYNGRGFFIIHNEEPVGFITYSGFHMKPKKFELDIWMKSEADCGKGFGTDAIVALGDYLGKTFGIRELVMRPSFKNKRAVKSNKNAGFKESDAPPDYYMLEEYISLYGPGDYGEDETALLIKQL